jgi:hypothetical protein
MMSIDSNSTVIGRRDAHQVPFVSARQDHVCGLKASVSQPRLDRRCPDVWKRRAHRVDEELHALASGWLSGKSLFVIDEVVGCQPVDEVDLPVADHVLIEALDESCPDPAASMKLSGKNY